jgi:hypothetical protein
MRARFLALALAACAGAAWLYGFVGWLVTGVWVPQPISSWLLYSGVGVPTTSSLHGRILRDYVLDFPAPVAVFGLAVVLWMLSDKLQEATA